MSSPTVPVPIRLDPVTRDRLRAAARRMGSNPSAVIRFAIINQLGEIESGRITIRSESRPSIGRAA